MLSFMKTTTIALILAVSLSACFESRTENKIEDVGEQIEDTTENAVDSIKDGADEVEDSM